MAYTKTHTYQFDGTYADEIAFMDWYVLDFMATVGWTTAVWSDDATDSAISVNKYYSFKREITNKYGTKLPYNLIIEIEPSSSDINWYSWDGVSPAADYAPNLLTSDTNFSTLTGACVFTIWQDDQSDGYFLLRNNLCVGMQLPNGGWLEANMNTSSEPASRPYTATLPIWEYADSVDKVFIQNITVADVIAGLQYFPSEARDVGKWCDYTTVGVSSTKEIWQDQTKTWKMRAETKWTGFNTTEVRKIDDEYYLYFGPFMVPAGSTEPEL